MQGIAVTLQICQLHFCTVSGYWTENKGILSIVVPDLDIYSPELVVWAKTSMGKPDKRPLSCAVRTPKAYAVLILLYGLEKVTMRNQYTVRISVHFQKGSFRHTVLLFHVNGRLNDILALGRCHEPDSEQQIVHAGSVAQCMPHFCIPINSNIHSFIRARKRFIQ